MFPRIHRSESPNFQESYVSLKMATKVDNALTLFVIWSNVKHSLTPNKSTLSENLSKIAKAKKKKTLAIVP